jgi:hypothetical protein
MVWKLSYQHIEESDRRYPFWKRTAHVEADSRQETVDKVKGSFPPPRYGNYKASKCKTDRTADHFFTAIGTRTHDIPDQVGNTAACAADFGQVFVLQAGSVWPKRPLVLN